MRKKIYVVIFVIISLCTLLGCTAADGYVENNTNDEIMAQSTEVNINSTVQELTELVDEGLLTVEKFLAKFPNAIERKTTLSHYFVQKNNDGSRIFAYVGKEVDVVKVEYYEKFPKLDDFNFINIGKTTYYDVLQFDTNFVSWGFSTAIKIAFIAEEGVVIIQFTRPEAAIAGSMSDVVESMEFIPNDELETMDILKKHYIDVSYILPEDKITSSY